MFGIICMACASPALVSATHWFLFVAVTSFIATLLWTFVYLLGIREVLTLPINWILTELINTSIAAVFYFIAFIVQLSTWSSIRSSYKGANMTAGVSILCHFLSVVLLFLYRRFWLMRKSSSLQYLLLCWINIMLLLAI